MIDAFEGGIQLHAEKGEMCVWVVLPGGSRSMSVYRFDGSPLAPGFILRSRDRAIIRAMLSDAIDQLDRCEDI